MSVEEDLSKRMSEVSKMRKKYVGGFKDKAFAKKMSQKALEARWGKDTSEDKQATKADDQPTYENTAQS